MRNLFKFFAPGEGGGEPESFDTSALDKAFEENFGNDETHDENFDPRKPIDEGESGDKTDKVNLDENIVRQYLEGKGIKANSIDDLAKNLKKGSEYEKRFQNQSQILAKLRRNPRFAEVLQDFLETGGDFEDRKAPEGLDKVDPGQLKQAQERLGYILSPTLKSLRQEIKDELKSELHWEKFTEENPDWEQYEEAMVALASELGVTKRDYRSLTKLLRYAKKEETDSISDRASSEDKIAKRIKLGTPPTSVTGRSSTPEPKMPRNDMEFEVLFNKVFRGK